MARILNAFLFLLALLGLVVCSSVSAVCINLDAENCNMWARQGLCSLPSSRSARQQMKMNCAKACGYCSEPSGCVLNFNSSETSSGVFNTPNHPLTYPPNMECEYRFYGQSDQRVMIQFLDFSVEGIPPRCKKSTLSDHVALTNYAETEDRRLGRLCGEKNTQELGEFWSDGPFFRVVFKSNDLYNATGFKATYKFVRNDAETESYENSTSEKMMETTSEKTESDENVSNDDNSDDNKSELDDDSSDDNESDPDDDSSDSDENVSDDDSSDSDENSSDEDPDQETSDINQAMEHVMNQFTRVTLSRLMLEVATLKREVDDLRTKQETVALERAVGGSEEINRVATEGPENIIYFTAGFDSDTDEVRNMSPIVFSLMLDEEGGGYDSSTGVFTAPRAGFYLFHLTVMTDARDMFIALKVNGRLQSSLRAGGRNHDPSTMSSVIKLDADDQVQTVVQNVYPERGVIISKGPYSVFSGFLLKPL